MNKELDGGDFFILAFIAIVFVSGAYVVFKFMSGRKKIALRQVLIKIKMNTALYILFLNLGGGEVVLILFVILLLFGGKGIPNVAKTLGKSIREFKDAASGLQKDLQQSTGGLTNEIQEHIQEVKKETEE